MDGDTHIMVQQTFLLVCRRTNNYFVAFLCTKVSSLLLQGFSARVHAYCSTAITFVKLAFESNSPNLILEASTTRIE
jgi:hypothetical protein